MTVSKAPIFVNGVQRSGTTLVIRMLSKSADIKFFPRETHLFPLLWSLGNTKSFADAKAFSTFIKEHFPKVNNGWTEELPYLAEICQSIIEKDFVPQSSVAALDFLLSNWQGKYPEAHVGEKTPAHIYYAEEIFKHCPNAKFIITVRDPRAIALSEMVKLAENKRRNARFNLFSFIARWESAHILAKKWVKKYGSHQVKYVKYEDIVLHPEETVRSLCSFVGVDFQPLMLEVGVVNSSFKDKEQTDKKFNTENLDRWRTGLDETQIAVIQHHLSDSMKELGYDIVPANTAGMKNQLKNSLKLKAAMLVCQAYPAYFHHLNRNEKYK
ncbi:MAG: sulfotransferase [Chitinophagales bacterium]|nr:sulfotransferase [Chitinophagales bacterium]